MARTDTDPEGSVIASLSVISPARIEGLEPYRRESAEGLHTLSSDALRRLARLNATLWVDT